MPSFTIFSGSQSGQVVQKKISKPDLIGDQILIRITASGLCGTDLHSRHKDKCLGHEGVGIVEAVGPEARLFKVGSRAGFGYLRNSCGQCKECLSGHEIFCPERDTYALPSDIGSLASHAIWRESYAFEIPQSMSDEDAAALMCGGATVFSALTLYDVGPTESVGIVGIGGLGHLAIQFAAKMGCEVTAFSGSTDKKEEAMSLGAHHFVVSRGVETLDLGERKLDRLLVTANIQPDWNLFIPTMAPRSTIVLMSVSNENLSMPYAPLIHKGIRVQGSLVASRGTQKEMFLFAARHCIKPIIMRFPLSVKGIEEGFEALSNGSMRYRGVLQPLS